MFVLNPFDLSRDGEKILSLRVLLSLLFADLAHKSDTTVGEEQFTNPVYVIENMDRHKGGTYICTANNGVGQVATSQIILHVLCK